MAIKNKNIFLNVYKDIWLKNTLISVSILLISILLLFVRANFSDTLAYINLSSAFIKDQMLSFDNINPIGIEYKVPMIYYSHAVFFENEIASAYQYINPLIFFVFVLLTLNDFNFLYIDKSNKKWFVIKNVLFNLGLVLVFWLTTYFTSSANLFLQSSILLFFIAHLKISKNIIIALLSTAFLPIFSSTGLINVFLLAIAALIYSFLFLKIKNFIALMFVSILMFSHYLPALLSGNKIGYLLMFIGWFFALAIISLLLIKKLNLNFVILNNQIKNNKMFFILYWSISFVFVLTTIVFFGFIYQFRTNYFAMLVFSALCFWVFVFSISLIQFKNKIEDTTTYLFPLFNLMPLIAMGGIYLIGFGDNPSVWRVIYLNFGMGGPIDIVLLLYIMVTIMVSAINKSYNIKFFKILFKKISYIFSFMISLMAVVFIPVQMDLKPEKISFSPNISTNINFFEKEDINYLKNFSLTNNQQIKLLTDTQVFYHLQNAQLMADLFFRTSIFKDNNQMLSLAQPWYVSSYNFLGSIQNYNYIYKNKISETNEFILNAFKQTLIEYDTTINTIILSNNTPYIGLLNQYLKDENTTFKMQYNSENIQVWSLNEQ